MQKDRIIAAIGQESIHNKKAEIKKCNPSWSWGRSGELHLHLPRSLQTFLTIVDFRYCKETHCILP